MARSGAALDSWIVARFITGLIKRAGATLEREGSPGGAARLIRPRVEPITAPAPESPLLTSSLADAASGSLALSAAVCSNPNSKLPLTNCLRSGARVVS